MTNYHLIQRRPRRGESLQQQAQQRTLPGPSTTTNAIRNYPGSQLDMKKAQDVGPATNSNHHTQVRMKDSGKQKNNKYYLKISKLQRLLQIGIRIGN